MNYLFTNVIGNFVLDKKLKLIDEGSEKSLKEKYPDLETLPQKKVGKILSLFKDKKNYKKFRIENLRLTKQSIKEAVSEDQLIIQSIANVNELVKVTNLLSKRLREWYSLYFPELSENIDDHETYVEMVSTKTKEELMQEIKVNDSFGADLGESHVDEIIMLSKEVLTLYKLRKKHEEYLETVMKKYCPNLLELAGITTVVSFAAEAPLSSVSPVENVCAITTCPVFFTFVPKVVPAVLKIGPALIGPANVVVAMINPPSL